MAEDSSGFPESFRATSSEKTGAVGPALDEELKRETRGLIQRGRSNRAQEWHDPEPAGEDQEQPDTVGLLPEDRRGTPPGMTSRDVEARAQIAQSLGPSAFPGNRDELLDVARRNRAPDRIIAQLGSLPAEERFGNVQDVARRLGIGTENART